MRFHSRKSHGLACALALLGAIAGSAGCGAAVVGGAAAAGAGAVAYSQGKLDTKKPAAVPVVQEATLEALSDMNLPVTSQRGDAGSGQVQSRFSDGTDITIDLKSAGNQVTEVGIRVGKFGDQARSQQILDNINKHLPANATASNVTASLL
jgi:hypothetical protein